MPLHNQKHQIKTPAVSGEHYKGNSDITGEYDLATYSFAIEYMPNMHLSCFWRVVPLRKGAMLYLNKRDEEERIFIDSPTSLLGMEKTLVEWANDCGISPFDEWFDTILTEEM